MKKNRKMTVRGPISFCAVTVGALLFSQPVLTWAQAVSPATKEASKDGALRDGQHDFDFAIGNWKFHLKRLEHPLTGSNTWVELDGTSTCRKIWDGRANIDEVEVNNPEKHLHIQGMTLRLYNPESHQWSLYWANAAKGALGLPPVIGQFKNGRGEFYDQEDFNGRAILFDTCGLISHRRRRILNNHFRTMGERRGKRTGSLIRLERNRRGS